MPATRDRICQSAYALAVSSVYHRAFEMQKVRPSHHPCVHRNKPPTRFVLLPICSPDPYFLHCVILDLLLLLQALLCPMTFSPTVKTEFQSSILSTPLYLVTQQPYKHRRVDSRMADPSSSPPMRTKAEPMDSLSPSTSIELHKRSKTGCEFAHR